MQIEIHKYQDGLLITVDGRLDSSWSDFFKDKVLAQIRSGEHKIIIDAEKVRFLSSVGIGAFAALYKELLAVQGSFKILNTQGMVRNTLVASKLDMWLSDDEVNWDLINTLSEEQETTKEYEEYQLNQEAKLILDVIDAWRPWDPVDKDKCKSISFEKNTFAFGIGAIGNSYEDTKEHFGEFVGLAGQVAYQPPNEKGRTDYLLSENEFIPSLNAIQALVCQGEFSDLIRFNLNDSLVSYKVSYLVKKMLEHSNYETIGFSIIGEIEGLVGCSTINSPGNITERIGMEYPEIKSWISFCGERVNSREQAVITGVASVKNKSAYLKPLDKESNIFGHLHSIVFPYQFLQNGKIELSNTVEKLFHNAPPKAVYHLINDSRSGNGIGESELYTAACWFAPIKNPEMFL